MGDQLADLNAQIARLSFEIQALDEKRRPLIQRRNELVRKGIEERRLERWNNPKINLRHKRAYDLRQDGLTYKKIGLELGVSAGRAREIATHHERILVRLAQRNGKGFSEAGDLSLEYKGQH